MEGATIIRILYCAASIQGIFLGILLVRSLNNHESNKILSLLLFLLSFHMVLVAFDDRNFFMTFPHLSRISWIIGSLYWPLLFLFVQSITRYRLPRTLNLLLFLPFVIFLAVMTPYYLLSAEQKRRILDDFQLASREDFGWINRLVSILHIFFQGSCLLFYSYIERQMRQEFSASNQIRILWLRQFLTGIFVVTVVAVFSFFARDLNIPVFSNLYSFHFIGLVILFYWLSYQALTKPVVFGFDVRASETASTSREAEPSPPERLEEAYRQIKNVLESEKLYKVPTLTLTELADKAGVARHLASEAINTQTDGNFFDLINDMRVQEFKDLATDPSLKHLNLIGIAQKSGFNSKASFYAIFKKKTGMTPSEYIKSTV